MAVERKSGGDKLPIAPPIRLGDFARKPVSGEEGDVLRVIESLRTGKPALPELPGVPSSIKGPETPTTPQLTIVTPPQETEKPQ